MATTHFGLGKPELTDAPDITTSIVASAMDTIDTEIYKIAGTPISNITANYTLQLADRGKMLYSTVTANITITIPTNASAAFTIQDEIVFARGGVGTVTFGGAGVTIVSSDSKKSINKQYEAATLKKIDTDTWLLIGSLAT